MTTIEIIFNSVLLGAVVFCALSLFILALSMWRDK